MVYGYITDQNPLADPEWKNLTLTRATCKECRYRPIVCKVKDIEVFRAPEDDYNCPCYMDRPWMPDDDWFCANFTQKEDT